MEKPQHMESAAAEKNKKRQYIPPKIWDTGEVIGAIPYRELFPILNKKEGKKV